MAGTAVPPPLCDLLRHPVDSLVDVCQYYYVAARHQRLAQSASDARRTSCHHRYKLHDHPRGYRGTSPSRSTDPSTSPHRFGRPRPLRHQRGDPVHWLWVPNKPNTPDPGFEDQREGGNENALTPAYRVLRDVLALSPGYPSPGSSGRRNSPNGRGCCGADGAPGSVSSIAAGECEGIAAFPGWAPVVPRHCPHRRAECTSTRSAALNAAALVNCSNAVETVRGQPWPGGSPRWLCLVPAKRDDVFVAAGSCFRWAQGPVRSGALVAVNRNAGGVIQFSIRTWRGR